MSEIIYVPIIKTGDAEIRGIENLSDNVKDRITPLIELTPSRKSPSKPNGDIRRRLTRLKEAYGKRQFVLDLIADPILANEQIEALQNNYDGYINWINFLVSLQADFPEIIPVIQISDKNVKNEKDFYDRIKKQVESLDEYFDYIVYRFPLEYEPYEDDLKKICEAISSNKIICVVDAAFITQEKASIYSTKSVDVINEIAKFSVDDIVLAATSFPKNPTEFGGPENGEFNLEEYSLFKDVKKKVDSALIYGDYATINPIRSVQAGGNGWVPRIDMPTKNTIYYNRSRKSQLEASYADAYIRVAKKTVKDPKYDEVMKIINPCWGTKQIELASQRDPQGLSPSFWISVRMNIHITIRETIC